MCTWTSEVADRAGSGVRGLGVTSLAHQYGTGTHTPPSSCTCTLAFGQNMHTCTHARTHTHTHARTHAHTHAHTCVCVCWCLMLCCESPWFQLWQVRNFCVMSAGLVGGERCVLVCEQWYLSLWSEAEAVWYNAAWPHPLMVLSSHTHYTMLPGHTHCMV